MRVRGRGRGALEAAGLRARADLRGESVGKKIAEAETDKVPVMLVVGDREAEPGAVSVRRHGRRDLGSQPLDEVVGWMTGEVAAKTPPPAAGTD